MSSSIYNNFDSWDVSNMMFWRVMDFCRQVGHELADSETEKEWLRLLPGSEDSDGYTFSPDIDADETFDSHKQIDFWVKVLCELSQRIFERKIGNQEDVTWQTSTIWAAHDLVKVLLTTKNQIKDSQES